MFAAIPILWVPVAQAVVMEIWTFKPKTNRRFEIAAVIEPGTKKEKLSWSESAVEVISLQSFGSINSRSTVTP